MKFNFNNLTHSPERLNVQTAKLGDPADVVSKDYVKFTDSDRGKPMKKGKQGNYLLCADGDAIEGFLDNVDAGPTADGMTVGGVAFCNRGARMRVYVKSNSAKVSVLDYVVAEDNATAGNPNTGDAKGLGVVKKAGAATKWRIVALEGDLEETSENACSMVPNPDFDEGAPVDEDTNPEEIEECLYPEGVIATVEFVG